MEDEEFVCAADRLQDLRSLVLDALSNDMSTTACWYANKLVTMSKGNAEDVLLLARTYYASGDFARTARALETHKAYGAEPLAQFRKGDSGDDAAVELRARLLAARALAKCGRHADCVSTLEPAMADIETYEGVTQDDDDEEELDSPSSSSAHPVKVDLAAAACSVVGQAYEALENRSRAVEWLKRALELDPHCAEAVSFLVERRLLSSSDESRLSSQLSRAVGKQNEWIGAVYGARLCVHPGLEPSSGRFEALDRVHGLGDNNEVLCARAEHCYYAHDSRSAHRLAKRVYNNDPFEFACVPVYLASMVELKLSHELFYCAHELVKSYPKRAASWFAVGCYYLLVGKNDAAQRYFHKSAKTCPRFAPAWIGFGNAFAAQDESEQAMAAYRSASRLFQGSHVPLLFIGMEYLRTNNLPLAKHFLRGAKALCPSTDPVVSNELGVVELRQGNYHDAEETFLESLEPQSTATTSRDRVRPRAEARARRQSPT
ncbi:MAG: hypothetical protein AAF447_16320 [Myxococcota bacterium]